MKQFILRFALLLSIALPCQANDVPPVTACATDVNSPPYLFTGDSNGTTMNQGFSVDVLQKVLQRMHLAPAQLRRLPWARCLNEVAIGNINIAINVPTAQVDPTPYWVTDRYVDVHSVYIFSKTNHPEGLSIPSLHELKRFKVCGLLGTRYDAYGLEAEQIDVGSWDYFSVFGKIGAKRCDLAIEKTLVLNGLLKQDEQLRHLYESGHLAQGKMPEDDMLGLHFIVSRKMTDGESLRNAINGEIQAMKKDHVLEKMLAKYL